MSTNTQTDSDEQLTVKKNVLITAYADQPFISARHFIAEAFDSVTNRDMHANSIKHESEPKIIFTIPGADPDERTATTKPLTTEIRSFLTAEQENIEQFYEDNAELFDDHDAFEYTVEHSESVVWDERHPTYAVDDLVTDCLETDILDDLGFEHNRFGYQTLAWERQNAVSGPDNGPDATETHKVSVQVDNTIKPQKVLVHQSARTAENRFMDTEQFAVQLSVDMEATDTDEIDTISDTIVPKLYNELASLDHIKYVRLSNCTMTTVEQGDCYGR